MRKIVGDTWVEIDGSVAVGVTKDFLEEAGDVTFVNFQKGIGDEVKEGDVLASLETVKSVVEVKSPISGKVEMLNEDLKGNPDKLNEDPENVWLVKIEVSEDELKKLKEG